MQPYKIFLTGILSLNITWASDDTLWDMLAPPKKSSSRFNFPSIENNLTIATADTSQKLFKIFKSQGKTSLNSILIKERETYIPFLVQVKEYLTFTAKEYSIALKLTSNKGNFRSYTVYFYPSYTETCDPSSLNSFLEINSSFVHETSIDLYRISIEQEKIYADIPSLIKESHQSTYDSFNIIGDTRDLKLNASWFVNSIARENEAIIFTLKQEALCLKSYEDSDMIEIRFNRSRNKSVVFNDKESQSSDDDESISFDDLLLPDDKDKNETFFHMD